MTQITAAMVKELREQTGAGMMDVKSALTEAGGNMEEATKILRKKGLAAASKKAGRVTSEGAVVAHGEGNVGVLVEVNCETDFVARTDAFREFATDVAKIIAQSKANTVEELNGDSWPGNGTVADKTKEVIASIKENITIRRFARFVAPEGGAIASYIHAGGKIGVMVELVANKAGDTEREIARDQAAKSGKPENIVEKMVSGKMEKFYAEACLLEQPYIRNDKQNVGDYVKSQAKEHGCEYTVTRFVRYKLGEGIEKKSDDFAAEVASYMK
jgi:elongation factor Ts